MWNELTKHLPNFRSAVLTGIDPSGYPCSFRCRPQPDVASQTLRIEVPDTVDVQPGVASLLCHRHDENLWNLYSFLVRGRLERRGDHWVFVPQQFIPGGGIDGLRGFIRFVARSRRNAKRYLERRKLPRPRIPWDAINAVKVRAQ